MIIISGIFNGTSTAATIFILGRNIYWKEGIYCGGPTSARLCNWYIGLGEAEEKVV